MANLFIDDFVLLGQTWPQKTKSGITICTAGYSEFLRHFVRVYPFHFGEFNHRRWDRLALNLRRNNKDTRQESYRILENTECKILGEENKNQWFDKLKKLSSCSTNELNDKRLSLGILSPGKIKYGFEYAGKFSPDEQTELFCNDNAGDISSATIIPRLEFMSCGVSHNLMLRDWGCSEWIRKNPDEKEKLWDNLRLSDSSYEHLLFVGNMNFMRNRWLVISVISRKAQTQQALTL